MKRLAFIILIILTFASCEKPVKKGSLFITVEYDGFAEQDVEVWLYESRYAFDNFEYYDKQFSDENGEVFWGDLDPGKYYIEAEITKPVDFHLYAVDSTDVFENEQRNKRLILFVD